MIKFHFSFREILAAYYWAAYLLHHALCLRPGKALRNSRLIVVGSFRAGGAGKTPFTLWLARELLGQGKTVAILCHKKAIDEVRMYQSALCDFVKQGNAEIHSTENRYKSASQLDSRQVAPDFILCDDGFEDSRLQPHVIFRMDWENAPTEINQLIPAGKFRSLLQDHKKDAARTIPLRCYGANPDVIFGIQSITNTAGNYPNYKQTIAICGLGDPDRFFIDLKKAEYPPQKTIALPDHCSTFETKLKQILRKNSKANVIISEKDSFRLSKETLQSPNLFVTHQYIQITRQIQF